MRDTIVSLNFRKYINLQVGILIEHTLTSYKAAKKTNKRKILTSEQQKTKLLLALMLSKHL